VGRFDRGRRGGPGPLGGFLVGHPVAGTGEVGTKTLIIRLPTRRDNASMPSPVMYPMA